ncbi:hypothetical protein [Pseudoalteromonas phage PH357]|nr:hypothetical protein [Pseudoalteromonas phage PH357]
MENNDCAKQKRYKRITNSKRRKAIKRLKDKFKEENDDE